MAFPEGAQRGQVDPDILQNMGLVYLPIVTLLYGLGIVCLSLFNIDKAKHEENLRKLEEVAARTETASVAEDAVAGAGAGALSGGAPPLGSKA